MPQLSVQVRKVVEFAETDAAGMLHFSNYLRYVEIAERALFAQWEVPLFSDQPARMDGYPRVRVQCDYSAPLRFGDEVEVTLRLVAWSPRSLTYRFRFERIAPGPRERVAKGQLSTVRASYDRASGRLESTSLPPELLAQLPPAGEWSDEED